VSPGRKGAGPRTRDLSVVIGNEGLAKLLYDRTCICHRYEFRGGFPQMYARLRVSTYECHSMCTTTLASIVRTVGLMTVRSGRLVFESNTKLIRSFEGTQHTLLFHFAVVLRLFMYFQASYLHQHLLEGKRTEVQDTWMNVLESAESRMLRMSEVGSVTLKNA